MKTKHLLVSLLHDRITFSFYTETCPGCLLHDFIDLCVFNHKPDDILQASQESVPYALLLTSTTCTLHHAERRH